MRPRGTLRVFYPSGRAFTLEGELHLVFLPLDDDVGEFPGVMPLGGSEMYMLDPRAVVMQNGAVLVDPRRTDPARAYRWVREWLADHPEWPAVLLDEAAR